MSTEIRIYVACLAAYNAGCLHGTWIDATQDVDDIQHEINAMLAASPETGAEEFAIHDYEGFEGYSLSEYAGIETAHKVALFIEEFPQFGAALLSQCGDIEEARQSAEEDYCGCYSSPADYAQELTEQTTEIPQSLAHHIDYERMVRDMEMNGDIFSIEVGYETVHIFWNR